MKKKLMIILALFTVCALRAQEYKLAKSTGKLVVKEVNRITFEGYAGNEIVFSSVDGNRDKDNRAAGLRSVSASGLEDNTGIGLSVTDKGTTYEVYQLKKMDGPRVKVLVPKGVSIYYSHTSPHGSGVSFKNIEGEIEVSTVHNEVSLENVSGPLTIKTVHGKIEAELGANFKTPLSLTSTHGLVDLTLPATAKANMIMSSSWGEIFVDPAFKLEVETKGEMVKYSSNKVNGKINGGGPEISLTSQHDNVYLRKK